MNKNLPSPLIWPRRWVVLDCLVLGNLLLYLPLAVMYHYPTVLRYRGAGNLMEFYLYAVALLSVILTLWAYLRRITFAPEVLLLLQVGVLLHFAGGLLSVSGGRLYDWHWWPGGDEWSRFDKPVHVFNSFAVAFGLRRTISILRQGSLAMFLLVFTTLGLGALHELLEFVVAQSVIQAGVGSYQNNMLDLAANLLGALLAAVLPARYFPAGQPVTSSPGT